MTSIAIISIYQSLSVKVLDFQLKLTITKRFVIEL